MKKHLKCIKKLPLAKSILTSFFFITLSPYVFAEDLYDLTGKINEINIDGNFCSMLIIDSGKWVNVENKAICGFLQRAKDFSQDVKFKYRLRNGYSDAKNRNQIVSVSYANENAYWFNRDKSGDNQNYSLTGNIENVFYNENGRCYVAVSENKYIKNKYDGTFHETNNTNICKLAESAFYLGLKVKMNATVDRTQNYYANDIIALNISSFCTKKSSHYSLMTPKIDKKKLVATLLQ